MDGGEPWFVATDVCKVLGLSVSQAVKGRRDRNYEDGIDNDDWRDDMDDVHIVDKAGRKNHSLVVNEGGLYDLIFKSHKPEARPFKRWVTHELIPTIRKTGAYITNKADPEMLRKQADRIETVDTINSLAQTLLPVYSAAGMKPQFQLMALKQLYGKANLELPTEGVTFDKELFDTMKIASRLGILSTNGKPHGHAVHAILSKIKISENERELVPYTRNGHSGTMYQYTESVVEKVRKWLMENGYPETVIKDSGKRKTIYRVDYKVNGGVAV
mgnify:CR=1 FL=1